MNQTGTRHELNYPKKVHIGDITVRDGFQHEEIWIPTEAKLYYAEELILCGLKHVEVTNFGNPALMPQFKDAETLLKQLRNSKRLSRAGVNWSDITLTVVTIRERSVDRAIEARKEGWGPDRILMMVSTDEEHHFANSGTTLPDYWEESKRCIEKAADVG
ncbi:MAG: pyruvate carboxyltransferase, partial [Thermodesulfobacteriota bacterium]